MVGPIQTLKRASKMIASGDYDTTLDVQSSVLEIRELALHLEKMRSNLVGINARLKSEIAERESAEAGKKSLESKLRHAQRLESLGTLAGGVAHEFNNVLQPLMLYTDLAMDDIPDDSPARRHLDRVIELAYDAKGLSQQILTFGRIGGEADLRPFNLASIVDEALAMVSALLPATIDIDSDIDADIGLVTCDQRQIQQLVVNLCSNAFQSLPKGTGNIELKYFHSSVTADEAARHHGLHAGDHAVIEVSDTGIGMDEQTQRRIFEPFYTTQAVGEGTGLGLSVVHGIVVRHGGSIVVNSKEGEGSRFRVYLPIVDREKSRRQEIG
jgi:signal transduction histidine kinase